MYYLRGILCKSFKRISQPDIMEIVGRIAEGRIGNTCLVLLDICISFYCIKWHVDAIDSIVVRII